MQCISPISLPRPNGVGNADRIEVPCGKCYACLTNRRNDWAVRLQVEHKYATSAFFITLTYNELEIPYNPVVDELTGEIRYVPSVRKKDLQLYFKRIRKYSTCRYYAVGEYGTNTKRPHYHILLFSYDINYLDKLHQCWPFGHIKIGTVSESSIMYTCKYHVNRTDYPECADPSFCLMSRRPGIGYAYLESPGTRQYYEGWTDRAYFPLHGRKLRLPRYLRDKLYSEDERKNLIYNIQTKEETPHERYDRILDEMRLFSEKTNIKKRREF